MKVYTKIGSKERLSEIFQKVNKVQLSEGFGQNYNSQSVLELAFSELKNNTLNIEQSKTQGNGDESFVELICIDKSGNNITFTFKSTTTAGDQTGVYAVDGVSLVSFTFDSSDGSDSVEMLENELKQFNAQHGSELFDVIDKYIDIEDEEPVDSLYEDAINQIDSYAPNVSQISPTIDEMSTYRNTDNINMDTHKYVLVHLWDAGAMSGVKVAVFGRATSTHTGEKKWKLVPDKPIIFVSDETLKRPDIAYIQGKAAKDFLSQQGYGINQSNKTIKKIAENSIKKQEKHIVYAPKVDENLNSILNYSQGARDKGSDFKTKLAVSYQYVLVDTLKEIGVNVQNIEDTDNGYYKIIGHYNGRILPFHINGNKFNNASKVKELIKKVLMKNKLMEISLNEDEEKNDYPDQIGKKFKTKSQYVKKKKKPQTTVKLSESEINIDSDDVEINTDGMSQDPEIDKIDQLAQDKEETGEMLQGGLGDEKSPLEFDPDQILKGLKVEMEHSDNPMIALEIVMDHLSETPNYYGNDEEDPEVLAQKNAEFDAKSDVDDKEMTDTLLGFKPHNVGDETEDDEEVTNDEDETEEVIDDEDETEDNDDETEKFNESENERINKVINEEQIKMAKQALNKRGITEGITKKEAVEILIKNNLKNII